ncbi:helix-turn-helix transcriptional regulator [Halarcobacter sp.]|uniref:helix-turn-helix transcriptional regulator n=1 Tax=Halarcobacter sp. TaxID=2321133 RepID=UPI003A92E5FF
MNISFENLEKIDTILEKLNALEQKISSEKRWLNVSETAHYLGYSKDHIHKLKNEHFLQGVHYHKKSGRVLFDKIELDKWVTTSLSKVDTKEIINNVLKGVL